MDSWLFIDISTFFKILISAVVTYAAILFYTRLTGLRSFSKMSSADFAMTVAVGSLFGSTIATPSTPLFVGLVALAFLYLGQWGIAWSRLNLPWTRSYVDNEPVLLMAGNEFLEDNLAKTNVTREDILAKLREANAKNFDEVFAVVLETTGDVSVIHSTDRDAYLELEMFSDVIDSDKLSNREIPRTVRANQ